jgi:hypothetical protein
LDASSATILEGCLRCEFLGSPQCCSRLLLSLSLLAYDFDLLVPGHHSNPSTKDDVKLVQAYVMDIYDTIKRIHDSDHKPVTSEAAQKYGSDNTYAIAGALMQNEVDQCEKEIKDRWMTKLDNVDVWVRSQYRTALVYYEWDVGPRPHR